MIDNHNPKKCMIFACMLAPIVFLFYYAAIENNTWLLFTIPSGLTCWANPAIGYSTLSSLGARHIENVSILEQLSMFYGWVQMPDFYFLRIMAPALANPLAPLFGFTGAALIFNLMAAAGSCVAAAHLSKQLGANKTGVYFVAVSVIFGSGFVFHASDLSAHSASFFLYFLGATLIWKHRDSDLRNWKSISLIFLLFAAASLTYKSALFLLPPFALVCVLNRNYAALLFASIAVLMTPVIYEILLMAAVFFGGSYFGTFAMDVAKYDVVLSGDMSGFFHFMQNWSLSRTEGSYFSIALEKWVSLASNPPELVGFAAKRFLDYFVFENPITLALMSICTGIVCLNFPRWKDRILLATLFLLPIVASMFWVSAGARGYLVYGSAVVGFAAMGAVLFPRSASRIPKSFRFGAAFLTAASQLAWVGAGALGVVGILKIYFLGWALGFPSLIEPTLFMDLAQGEGYRHLYGTVLTNAYALGENAYLSKSDFGTPMWVQLGISVATTLPFVGLLWLLAWTWRGRRFGLVVLITATTVFGGSRLADFLIFDTKFPEHRRIFEGLPLAEPLSVTIQPAEGVWQTIRETAVAGDRFLVLLPGAQGATVEVTQGGAVLASGSVEKPLEIPILDPDRESGPLTIHLTPVSDDAAVSGWRRASPTAEFPESWSPLAPAIQLLVVGPKRHLKFLGY